MMRQAVDDGILVDVTDAARNAHIKRPASVLITATLLSGVFEGSSEKLHEELHKIWAFYRGCFGFDHLGSVDFKNCTVTLEHDEELGRVMLLSEPGGFDSLGFKRNGRKRFEYLT